MLEYGNLLSAVLEPIISRFHQEEKMSNREDAIQKVLWLHSFSCFPTLKFICLRCFLIQGEGTALRKESRALPRLKRSECRRHLLDCHLTRH